MKKKSKMMIGNVAFELHLARSQLEKYVALIHSMLFIIGVVMICYAVTGSDATVAGWDA